MPIKNKFTSKDYTGPLRKPGEQRVDLNTQEGKDETSSASNETDKGTTLVDLSVPRSEKGAEDVTSPMTVNQETDEKPVEGVSPVPLPLDAGKDKGDTTTELSVGNESGEKPACEAEKMDKPLDEKEQECKLLKESNFLSSKTTKETAKTEDSKNESDQKEQTVTNHNETSLREPTSKIKNLSPFAREFVPKASLNPASVVEAPEFVPATVPQQPERPPLLQRRNDTPENELMNCVKDVLFGLTQSPGELDYYYVTLVDKIKKSLGTLTSLKEVVDLIFEYSITEPNFQYIAAKLCNLLSMEEAIFLENGERFRSVFMNRCRDEHTIREEAIKNPQTLVQLLGFAMFEAELFCNYRPLGESEPLKVFHRGLLEMLSTLLQNHTEECLTCIGKILKMTGYLLDDPRFKEIDKERKQKVDKVFSDVEELLKESTLSESAKRLLSQVIKLRASKWTSSLAPVAGGTSFDFPPDNGYSLSDYGLGLDDLTIDDYLTPVTNPEQWSEYFDDGEDDTEQQEAYRYYFPENLEGDFSHEDGGFYLEDDPEFDDEIEQEFEKFLQEQGEFQ